MSYKIKSKYGISGKTLEDLRLRDQNCVYCRVPMPHWKDKTNPMDFATIEHIYPPGNDPTWVSWCCNGCNINHQKSLREWFKSPYCIAKNINEQTVAPIIREFLASGLKDAYYIWMSGREDKLLNEASWISSSEGGQQSIQRSTFSESDIKVFDRVLSAIGKCRYDFAFRGMKVGTFGRYYSFMYWIEGGTLNRMPFSD